jgi:hypothetical protein
VQQHPQAQNNEEREEKKKNDPVLMVSRFSSSIHSNAGVEMGTQQQDLDVFLTTGFAHLLNEIIFKDEFFQHSCIL